jgi:chaperone required for assembly of F1-ATPase
LSAKATPPAGFAEPAVVAEGTGFTVALDGKKLKTPAGTVVSVAKRAFAEAMAAEWTGVLPRTKGAKVDLDRVPLTRIASTVIDRLPSRRAAVIDELLAHAETELLCYRALEPRELARRQTEIWQPILDWLVLAYDARLETHTTMLPADQPPESLAARRGERIAGRRPCAGRRTSRCRRGVRRRRTRLDVPDRTLGRRPGADRPARRDPPRSL